MLLFILPLVWLGAAKECQSAEQSAAVFEALSSIYQETLDVAEEDRSLVDLSVEKLYFGGYEVKCFELHSLLTNVKSHKFKASVLSMARTVLKLSHELDETNIEFINKGINLLADFNNIQAKAATLGAAASALGKAILTDPEMRKSVRRALAGAGRAENFLRMNEALGLAWSSLSSSLLQGTIFQTVPEWFQHACQKSGCLKHLWRRVGQGKKIANFAGKMNVAIQATIVMSDSVRTMYEWSQGKMFNKRAVIKVASSLAGTGGAWAGVTGGVAVGAAIGKAMGDYGAAIGSGVGGMVGGMVGYMFLSSITENFLASWMDVAPEQRMEEAYRLLGVHHSSSNADINRAFRQKALELHPDKRAPKDEAEKDLFEKEFVALNVAVETIRVGRFTQLEKSMAEDDLFDSEQGSEEEDLFSRSMRIRLPELVLEYISKLGEPLSQLVLRACKDLPSTAFFDASRLPS